MLAKKLNVESLGFVIIKYAILPFPICLPVSEFIFCKSGELSSIGIPNSI